MSDDITGAVMDRPIERSRWKKPLLIGIPGILLVALIVVALLSDKSATLRVDASGLAISEAMNGTFENYVTLQMRAVPERTLRVTSISTGRIISVHARNGDQVTEDQVLFEIGSFDLERQIQAQESTVLEAQGDLQKQRIDLDDQIMQRESTLATKRFELAKLNQELERKRELAETGDISAAELGDYEAQYKMQDDQLKVEEKLHASFIESTDIQRNQFKRMAESLDRDLKSVDRLRDSVNIRAPADGVLSGFTLDVGDSVTADSDVASVHSADRMKMQAAISEDYIEEVYEGLSAIADYEGRPIELTLSRIDPDINEGAFSIEFSFANGQLETGLRRGRTMTGRLLLSEPRPALMISSGPYFSETGGKWLFVIDPETGNATRRTVVLGDSNVRLTEVLEGLTAGERVVTSSYRDYMDMTELQIEADD